MGIAVRDPLLVGAIIAGAVCYSEYNSVTGRSSKGEARHLAFVGFAKPISFYTIGSLNGGVGALWVSVENISDKVAATFS